MRRAACLLPLVFIYFSCTDRISRAEEFRFRSECATRADKVRTDSRFAPGGALQRIVLQSEAHYNCEMNRCLVYFKFLDMVPTHAEDLVDAYENTTIISCIGSINSRSCVMRGQSIKSEEADKRIREYMER